MSKRCVFILHIVGMVCVVCIHVSLILWGSKKDPVEGERGKKDIAACQYYRLDDNDCLHRKKCGKYKIVEWIRPEDILDGMFEMWCSECFSGEDYYKLRQEIYTNTNKHNK